MLVLIETSKREWILVAIGQSRLNIKGFSIGSVSLSGPRPGTWWVGRALLLKGNGTLYAGEKAGKGAVSEGLVFGLERVGIREWA